MVWTKHHYYYQMVLPFLKLLIWRLFSFMFTKSTFHLFIHLCWFININYKSHTVFIHMDFDIILHQHIHNLWYLSFKLIQTNSELSLSHEYININCLCNMQIEISNVIESQSLWNLNTIIMNIIIIIIIQNHFTNLKYCKTNSRTTISFQTNISKGK